jgi:hypothetical protein
VQAPTKYEDVQTRRGPKPRTECSVLQESRLRTLLRAEARKKKRMRVSSTPLVENIRDSCYRAGAAATVHRPAPIIVVAMPSFIVEPA